MVSLVELPLVLPPAVAGLGLFATFGRLGLLGSTLDALGLHIALTQAAVVLAVAFVAGPFYVRTAVAAGRAFTKITGFAADVGARVLLPPVDGSEPDTFEREFAEHHQSPFAVAVSSGTSALENPADFVRRKAPDPGYSLDQVPVMTLPSGSIE